MSSNCGENFRRTMGKKTNMRPCADLIFGDDDSRSRRFKIDTLKES
jgi:ribosome-binding factor A